MSTMRGWRPDLDVERGLIEAKRRGDHDGYLRLLAGADIFSPVLKEIADDAVAGRRKGTKWVAHDQGGRTYARIYTRGALPADPRYVFSMEWLSSVARSLPDGWWVVVDAGVPVIEQAYPGAALAHATRDPATGETLRGPGNNLLSALDSGPAHGPLAFALACGAHLAVYNSLPWNALDGVADDYMSNLRMLRESWGVTGPAEWRETIDTLLGPDSSDPLATLALDLRHHELGGNPGMRAWRETIARWCGGKGIEPATIRKLLDRAQTINRYEERFRADGLLPPNGYVKTMRGYDFGRAVNMARWGLTARFCDAEAAEKAVRAAGGLSRGHYDSWADFSAGYALGRVLRFDEEEFGEWYRNVLIPHRVLTGNPASPWRTMVWGPPARTPAHPS